MRFRNAALGLAAVGAGLLVAGLLRRREEEGGEHAEVPPGPAELIGQPLSNKSAVRSAQVLETDTEH